MSIQEPRIYVVDDDDSVCRSVALLLEASGFKAQCFTRAADFLTFRHPKAPSCLILDIEIPDINGLDLQDAMRSRNIRIPVIFITGHGDIPKSVRAMKAGAVDFLQKPFTEKELLNAIAVALKRNRIEAGELTEISSLSRRVKTLSPRELEVFRFVAKGFMNKEIAEKRGTSLQTIKVHRGRVMKKMRAKNITELVSFAKKTGIIPSGR